MNELHLKTIKREKRKLETKGYLPFGRRNPKS